MAAVPEGESVYDQQGTVLYRVVSKQEHVAETHPELAQATLAASAAVGGGASGTRTTRIAAGPSTQSGRLLGGATASAGSLGVGYGSAAKQNASALPARLTPLATAASLGGPAAATNRAGAAAGTGEETRLAALLMLDRLFPPVRLDADGYELPEEGEAAAEAPGATSTDHQRMGDESTNLRSSRGVAGPPANGGVSVTQRSTDAQWLKVAAVDHTSRLDVVLLKQHLEKRCAEEHARPRGTLCPIREGIFNDGLREITRQVTVLCPERGQLMQELCDSMDRTTGTYDVLFDSACQYAVRKSTERDLKAYLFDEQRALESEVRRCENRVHELRAKYQGMQKRFEEHKAATEKVHEAEINYVKGSNQQIVSEIKRALTALEAGAK